MILFYNFTNLYFLELYRGCRIFSFTINTVTTSITPRLVPTILSCCYEIWQLETIYRWFMFYVKFGWGIGYLVNRYTTNSLIQNE